MSNGRHKIILSIGGSLIVPEKGIDTNFLTNLNTFVRDQLTKDSNRQFFLVIGGGSTAREYRDAGRDVVGHDLTRDDLDWLGIHATRLNAHLVRTIFRDIASAQIVEHYETIQKTEDAVIVASGWKPGWSTDYCAVTLAQDYDVKTIINLTNIDQVYDDDPRKNPDAKPLEKMNWDSFQPLVGKEWIPGMNAPFDPIASLKAKENNLTVVVLNGNNFENIQNYLDGKSFIGTVIE